MEMLIYTCIKNVNWNILPLQNSIFPYVLPSSFPSLNWLRSLPPTLNPIPSSWYTLTSKNFERFYFRTKPCPKIRLSEIFLVRTLKASKNFPRKEYWSWCLKDFHSIEITEKKDKYTWIKDPSVLRHQWRTLYPHHQSYSHRQPHFLCPQWFHVLLTLTSHISL